MFYCKQNKSVIIGGRTTIAPCTGTEDSYEVVVEHSLLLDGDEEEGVENDVVILLRITMVLQGFSYASVQTTGHVSVLTDPFQLLLRVVHHYLLLKELNQLPSYSLLGSQR